MTATGWMVAVFITTLCIKGAWSQCIGSPLSVSVTSTNTTTSISTTDPYSNNQVCDWQITAPSGHQIFLYLENVYLEWSYDFMYIYDGSSTSATQLYESRYTQNSRGVVLSSSTDLYVRFTSDYSITYSGFTLTMVAVDRSPLPPCGSTLTPTSTQTQAQISSVASEQGSNCYYTITATNSTDRISYQIPVAQSGSVYMHDGTPSGGYLFQSAGSSNYVSAGQTITLFSTHQFVLNYEEVSNTVTANIVTITTVPQDSICSLSGSTRTATSSEQYLTSQNYPGSYGNYLYCEVTITSFSVDSSVYVYFEDWDVDYSDYLLIYDGTNPSFNQVGSTWYTGSEYTSTGRSLHLVFTTGSSGNLRGFKLRYNETSRAIPSCASSYSTYNASATSATITSLNYPTYYTNNLEQYWLIAKPVETDNLVLTVTFMEIEEAINCVYDSLTFYDGPCTTDPTISVVCGTTEVTFEDSSGLYVLVRFKTDGSVVRTGFSMSYYTGAYDDGDDDDGGIPDWLPGLIIMIIIICIVIGVACFMFYRSHRANKTKVHSSEKEDPARPKLARKLTTHQLLINFKSQMNDDMEKKKLKRKPSRKDLGYVQPQHFPPNPPGPNTMILNRGHMTPHPPPQPPPPPPPGADPVYPPINYGGYSTMPQPVAPVIMTGGNGMPAPGYQPMNTGNYMIPSPFQYITPAEYRNMNEAQARPQA